MTSDEPSIAFVAWHNGDELRSREEEGDAFKVKEHVSSPTTCCSITTLPSGSAGDYSALICLGSETGQIATRRVALGGVESLRTLQCATSSPVVALLNATKGNASPSSRPPTPLRATSNTPAIDMAAAEEPISVVACLQMDGSITILDKSACVDSFTSKLVTGCGPARSACTMGQGRYLCAIGQSAALQIVDLWTLSSTHLLHAHEDWIDAVCAVDFKTSSCIVSYSEESDTVGVWEWCGTQLGGYFSLWLKWREPEGANGDHTKRRRRRRGRKAALSLSADGRVLLISNSYGRQGWISLASKPGDGVAHVEETTTETWYSSFLPDSSEYLVQWGGSAETETSVLLNIKGANPQELPFDLEPRASPCERCVADSACPGTRRFLAFASDKAMLRYARHCAGEALYVTQWQSGSGLPLISASIESKPERRSVGEDVVLLLAPPPRVVDLPCVAVRGDPVHGHVSASCFPEHEPVERSSASASGVTALSSPASWHVDAGAARALAVGRRDGSVEIWTVSTRRLSSHAGLTRHVAERAHFGECVGFSHPETDGRWPEEEASPPPSHRLFCSLGSEGDVVVLGLVLSSRAAPSLLCLHRLTGHTGGIHRVTWDLPSGFLHVQSDIVLVWNLRSGALARAAGATKDALLPPDAGTPAYVHAPLARLEESAWMPCEEIFSAGLGGAAPAYYAARRDARETTTTGPGLTCSEGTRVMDRRRKRTHAGYEGHLVRVALSDAAQSLRSSEPGSRAWLPLAACGALRVGLEWGENADLDAEATKLLGLTPPGRDFFYEWRDETPGLSIPAFVPAARRWRDSEELSAVHNLWTVAVFMAGMSNSTETKRTSSSPSPPPKLARGGEAALYAHLVTHYGIAFPDAFRARGEWREPSLATMARFSLSESEVVHVAARLILRVSIERISKADRAQIVKTWSTSLIHRRETMITSAPQSAILAGGIVSSASGPAPLEDDTDEAYLHDASHHALSGNQKLSMAFHHAGSSGVASSAAARASGLESQFGYAPVDLGLSEQLLARDYQLNVLLLASIGVAFPGELEPTTARYVTEGLVEPLLVGAAASHALLQALTSGGGGESGAPSSTMRSKLAVRAVSTLQKSNAGPKLNPASPSPHAERSASGSPTEEASELGARSPSGTVSGRASPAPGAPQQPSTPLQASLAAELLARNFPLFRPHIAKLNRLIQKLLYLSTDPTTASSSEQEESPGAAPHHGQMSLTINANVASAQRALLAIGKVQPVVYLRVLGSETIRRETHDAYRRRALALVVALVKDSESVMLRHLPMCAEVIIKTLDPSEPAVRTACLTASTKALYELVKRLPMVCFHRKSQRFAVGTLDSTVIIYDLRTATKWRILEGTEGAVSALAFDEIGDRLVSFSFQEGMLRLWQTGSSGFFGSILGIRGKCVATANIKPAATRPNARATLEWSGPDTVVLKRDAGFSPEIFRFPQA